MARAALLGIDLTDLMSGHFMVGAMPLSRWPPDLFAGLKILPDILTTGRGRLRIVELPATFRQRQHGESKLDSEIALDFAALVTAKPPIMPSLRASFCTAGRLDRHRHPSRPVAHAAGSRAGVRHRGTLTTVGAITWNFVLNNLFTYRDQRLSGWRFVTGLIRFQLICAVGGFPMSVSPPGYTITTAFVGGGPGGALMARVEFRGDAALVWRTPLF